MDFTPHAKVLCAKAAFLSCSRALRTLSAVSLGLTAPVDNRLADAPLRLTILSLIWNMSGTPSDVRTVLIRGEHFRIGKGAL